MRALEMLNYLGAIDDDGNMTAVSGLTACCVCGGGATCVRVRLCRSHGKHSRGRHAALLALTRGVCWIWTYDPRFVDYVDPIPPEINFKFLGSMPSGSGSRIQCMQAVPPALQPPPKPVITIVKGTNWTLGQVLPGKPPPEPSTPMNPLSPVHVPRCLRCLRCLPAPPSGRQVGNTMAEFPLDPQLAKMMVAAPEFRC